MGQMSLAGIHHVKFPVTDLERSRQWYERVFGLSVEVEFPDSHGVVRGVAGRVPGLIDSGLALRENPDAARALAGFDPVSFGVADRAALDVWAAHLDDCGVQHSPVVEASIGHLLIFNDPDGTELHLYSREPHGVDTSARPGHARGAQS